MSYQANAFQVAIEVADSVKRSAIEGAFQTVVLDHADHGHGVNWSLHEKLEHVAFFASPQYLGRHRLKFLGYVQSTHCGANCVCLLEHIVCFLIQSVRHCTFMQWFSNPDSQSCRPEQLPLRLIRRLPALR